MLGLSSWEATSFARTAEHVNWRQDRAVAWAPILTKPFRGAAVPDLAAMILNVCTFLANGEVVMRYLRTILLGLARFPLAWDDPVKVQEID